MTRWPITWFLVLSSSTRSCSWARGAISGPSSLRTSSGQEMTGRSSVGRSGWNSTA